VSYVKRKTSFIEYPKLKLYIKNILNTKISNLKLYLQDFTTTTTHTHPKMPPKKSRGRKKQKQRSRRETLEKTVDKMSLKSITHSVDVSMDKMLHTFNSGCLCPDCIDEEMRGVSEKEVNDKEKWIEDFKPIYEKASLNLNEKNKMIVKKYIYKVYEFAELKMRYERQKKVNELLSQLKL